MKRHLFLTPAWSPEGRVSADQYDYQFEKKATEKPPNLTTGTANSLPEDWNQTNTGSRWTTNTDISIRANSGMYKGRADINNVSLIVSLVFLRVYQGVSNHMLWCHGLSADVLPEFIDGSPHPQRDGIGKWGLGRWLALEKSLRVGP